MRERAYAKGHLATRTTGSLSGLFLQLRQQKVIKWQHLALIRNQQMWKANHKRKQARQVKSNNKPSLKYNQS